MKKSRVSTTISKRMALARKHGLSYREYMRRAHLKRRQKGMLPPRQKRPRDHWDKRTRRRTRDRVNIQTRVGMPHSLFVKGSSMVGAPGPKKLLRFQPTREMIAKGFRMESLRFYPKERAKELGLQSRQEWIDDMLIKLKGKGLF